MGPTPMMRQYLEIKEKCKDCILFFRLGDFYEMFFEDAEVVSRELELVLTGKSCGLEKRAPMCGVPFHASRMYISKLISKGYKVAICEQLEDPATTKKLVKRGIVKIITPGTYTDSSFLEDTRNNYIMSMYNDIKSNMCALCFVDVSTGEFNCTEFIIDEALIMNELSKFNPREILVQEDANEKILSLIKERFNVTCTSLDNECFEKDALEHLKKQFSNIDNKNYSNILLYSANGILTYIHETQKLNLHHINELNFYNVVDYLSIDINSRRNLELTETLRDKSKKGSLLWVIDKTNTAMGARQLRKWIEQPLIEKEAITLRLDAVDELICNMNTHEDLKESLNQIYDIERLVGKISSKSVNAKELISLKNSIEKIPNIKKLLGNFQCELLKNMYENLDELKDIYDTLDKAICDNPSISVKEGNIIKSGFNSKVDELRGAKAHGKEWIASLENNEKEVTGIKSLKVGYNKVFGYYIEVTKTNLELVPQDRYIRKQTLSNCERYITPELKEVEDKVLGAEEKLINLEYNIFIEIRDNIEKHIVRMQNTAKLISEVDCISSLASTALAYNYVKPNISEDGEIDIKEGRHPVIEKLLSSGEFVANDTIIDNKDNQMLLITGPNMAGKSTYMRQIALITILAQIGSFVPAKSAKISVCDKVFTRIGASDDLAAGKSTFMVEMWEVANILKNATNRSLILLDEVGRGTSTYDGLSIAWAVIEYICKNSNMRSKTLFATHYHELTKLEGVVKGVKNYSIAVKKVGEDIVFLRKIIEGGADESYGIEVAKLAGLPKEVITRSKEILSNLEVNNSAETKSEKKENTIKAEDNIKIDSKVKEEVVVEKQQKVEKQNVTLKQMDFTEIEKDKLISDITSMDILSMTPIDSLNRLYEIVKRAKAL